MAEILYPDLFKNKSTKISNPNSEIRPQMVRSGKLLAANSGSTKTAGSPGVMNSEFLMNGRNKRKQESLYQMIKILKPITEVQRSDESSSPEYKGAQLDDVLNAPRIDIVTMRQVSKNPEC